MIRLAAIFQVSRELSRKCLKFTCTYTLVLNNNVYFHERIPSLLSFINNKVIYIRDKKNIITEIADLVDFMIHVYILHFFLFR